MKEVPLSHFKGRRACSAERAHELSRKQVTEWGSLQIPCPFSSSMPLCYRVRDRVTGLPGVCPKPIGKQVREQHLGPRLKANGNKDIAGGVPRGPSQTAEPGPEISERCMAGPLGGVKATETRQNQRHQPRLAKQAQAQPEVAQETWGQNQQWDLTCSLTHPSWWGTGSSLGELDAA